MRWIAILAILPVALSGCAGISTSQLEPLAPGAGERPAPAAPAPSAPVTRPTPVPPAPPPTTPPPLTPEISPREQQRFLEEAQRKIDETEPLLRQLESRRMDPKEQEVFLTAQGFLDQARKALVAKEYERAANLASKARALIDDLTKVKK